MSKDLGPLIARLQKLYEVERELSNECDMPPEATANWEYMKTCEEAIEVLGGFKQQPAVESAGWCDWVMPIMQGYKMQCCGCGLVHEIEFHIAEWNGAQRVEFRMRRNKQ